MKKMLLIMPVGFTLLAGLYVGMSSLGAQVAKETPVTVGDGGSIVIEVPQGGAMDLTKFVAIDAAAISHPENGEMGCVQVIRGTTVIKRDKCKKGKPCVVTLLSAADPGFGDVSVTVRAAVGGKLTIRSNVPFDKWDRTTDPFAWKLPIAGKLTSVDLRDDNGAPQRNLCRNGNCKVVISYPGSFDGSKPCP